MPSIEVQNPIEIKLSTGNITYRGADGRTPVKGVDYFTEEDIDNIITRIENSELNIDLTDYATITYVDTGLSGKQGTLTAGSGINLSGGTISSTTEYLTNSDILAIWNGTNE